MSLTLSGWRKSARAGGTKDVYEALQVHSEETIHTTKHGKHEHCFFIIPFFSLRISLGDLNASTPPRGLNRGRRARTGGRRAGEPMPARNLPLPPSPFPSVRGPFPPARPQTPGRKEEVGGREGRRRRKGTWDKKEQGGGGKNTEGGKGRGGGGNVVLSFLFLRLRHLRQLLCKQARLFAMLTYGLTVHAVLRRRLLKCV